MLITHNFLPTILMPTRIKNTSATLIDHIYFFQSRRFMNAATNYYSGSLYYEIADHLPNYFCISREDNTNDRFEAERPLIRLFTDKNKFIFGQELDKIDWNKELLGITSSDMAYNIFHDNIKSIFNKSFPLVTLSRRGMKDQKWITPALKISSRCKNKLYKKWINSRKVNGH